MTRQKLATAVFDQLLGCVVDGTFGVNEAMPSERELCEELGVSRTAVREALARLAQLGLVAVRHGGETRVLDYRVTAGLDVLPSLLFRGGRLDPAVAKAGLEMRAALAPDVARLAALRAQPRLMLELEWICKEMEKSEHVAALQQLSLRFWAALVAASDNVAYQLAFNSLRVGMAAMADSMAVVQEKELRDLRGYVAIARSVSARDGSGAERAARAHIAIGMRALDELDELAARRGQR